MHPAWCGKRFDRCKISSSQALFFRFSSLKLRPFCARQHLQADNAPMSTETLPERIDAAIIGAGPAGLMAAEK
ncbi:MAG: hypothetical protein IJR28_03035, partial [Ottowia sp.]|nr:hypothetical protein [Ottowia sp.]